MGLYQSVSAIFSGTLQYVIKSLVFYSGFWLRVLLNCWRFIIKCIEFLCKWARRQFFLHRDNKVVLSTEINATDSFEGESLLKT